MLSRQVIGFPKNAILGKGFQAKPSGSKNPEGFLFPDCCNNTPAMAILHRLNLCMVLSYLYPDELSRGHIALPDNIVYREQYIGLRIVGHSIAFGNRIGHHHEQPCYALDTIVIIEQVYLFTLHVTGFLHILPVHEYHPPLVLYSAIAVLQSINGGIKLVMGTGRRQYVFILSQCIDGQAGNGKRPPVAKPPSNELTVPRRIGQIKAVFLPDTLIVVL